ncbi:MAG: phage terminase large subunit [Planctomycetaceae bacterium]
MVACKHKPLLIYDKQSKFRSMRKWAKGFVGGRGTGKTKIGAIEVLLTARAGEPWMAVSPTYVVLEDTTWPTFEETAKELGVWIRGIKSPVPRAWFRTQDGGMAELVFRSGDKPESLRGPSKAGLWIDEASICHSDVFKYGIAILRYKGRMGPVLLTFTPKGKRHWTFGIFYERIQETDGGQFIQVRGTDGESVTGKIQYERRRPDTGDVQRFDIADFGGAPFLVKPNAGLVQAHTRENPFLPEEFFETVRGHYTTALAAQELGGEFVELEGLMFRREWYLGRIVEEVPRLASRVRYWDRAATEGSGCYTAGVLMAMDRFGLFYVEDVVRGQWSAGQRDQIIIETAQRDAAKYGNEVVIYVEQEGGSGGKEVAEQMVLKLAGFPVYKDVVSGQRTKVKDHLVVPGEAKIIRAMGHAAQAEAGNVFLKNAAWVQDWIDEHCSFPEYAFADQVDATSGAFNKLARQGSLDAGQIIRTQLTGIEDTSRFGVQLIRSRAERLRFQGSGQQ